MALWLVACIAVTAWCQTPEQIVIDHVKQQANLTFREPEGYLTYPYLVPAGPYNQLWDWDSMFMGVALLDYGSAPYLAGSMKNFLAHTNVTTGEVRGCLTPDGSTGTIYHAKPIVIQGAWLVARYLNDTAQFLQFKAQMEALLMYWDTTRRQNATGLYVWHDQLESGADNLVTSLCPSPYSTDCWVEKLDAYTLASTDVMTFIYREHKAYANFLHRWAQTEANGASLRAEAAVHVRAADDIKATIDKYLWSPQRGCYLAYNVSINQTINNRVFLLGFPLFEGLASKEQAQAVLAQISMPDMMTKFGVRSTSSGDPRYTNANMIDPYSNWRGPVWINANVCLVYGLFRYGYKTQAMALAESVVGTLAADITATGTWHECYDSDTGAGLAAPGFLSWDTLGATLLANLRAGIDPFKL